MDKKEPKIKVIRGTRSGGRSADEDRHTEDGAVRRRDRDTELQTPASYMLSEGQCTLEECQRLISQCEICLENSYFNIVIKKIEQFLTRLDDAESFPYKEALGRLLSQLGTAYYKTKNTKAQETLVYALECMSSEESSLFYAKTLNTLSRMAYDRKDYALMAEYLHEANSLIRDITIDNAMEKMDILYNLILSYVLRHKYPECSAYINEYLEYSKTYEIYRNFGELNMLVAVCHKKTGSYDEALRYNVKALEYFTFTDNELYKHSCYKNMGILYRLKSEYEKSLGYFDQALKYYEGTGDMTRAGSIKAERIKTLFFVEYDDDKLLSELEEPGSFDSLDQRDRADILTIKGIIFLEKGRLGEALDCLVEAEKLSDEYNNEEFNSYTSSALAAAYRLAEQEEAALSCDSQIQTEGPLFRKIKRD